MDLDDILKLGNLTSSRKKGRADKIRAITGEKSPAERRAAEAAAREAKRLAAIREAGPRWRTLRAELLLATVTCRCGNSYEVPSKQLNVVFEDLKTGGTWSRHSPLGLIPPHVKRVKRTLPGRTCEACPECFRGSDCDHRQLDLFRPEQAFRA